MQKNKDFAISAVRSRRRNSKGQRFESKMAWRRS